MLWTANTVECQIGTVPIRCIEYTPVDRDEEEAYHVAGQGDADEKY
jgi:hypothetical protein